MEVGDDRVLTMLMEIRQELSELKGEIKGFNSSLAKIDAADARARKAEAIALEAQHQAQALKEDFVQHQQNQIGRDTDADKEKSATRRWLIGILVTVVLSAIASLIAILR